MSSTNKTTNLKLNDWVGTDVPQREDFNADNQRIDKAIGDHTGNTTVHITQVAGPVGAAVLLLQLFR